MNKKKNKFAAVIIATFFILSIIASTTLTADAHTPPWTIQTYAYVTASPSSWGLGSAEPMIIVFWINSIPPTAAGTTGDRWLDMTIDVTDPSNTTTHFGPFQSDPVGGAYMSYTPTEIGAYSVLFTFPTQNATAYGGTNVPSSSSFTNALVNDTYLGSTATTTFEVTNTPTSYFQEAPLPVSYWTRPINENNQYWYAIGSSWLGQGEYGATYLKYNPNGNYLSAPNTAHVSVTYPLTWGGIVGGDNAVNTAMSFYSGSQYQLKFPNPIIMYGTLFFSEPQNNAPTGNGIAAMDLRTGEILWRNPNINSIMVGQLYDFESPNQHGTTGSYLWASSTIVGTSITNVTAAAVNATKYPIAPGTDLGAIASTTKQRRIQPIGLDGN